jgi:hypothetical protein
LHLARKVQCNILMSNAAISGPRRVRAVPVQAPVSHGPPPLPTSRARANRQPPSQHPLPAPTAAVRSVATHVPGAPHLDDSTAKVPRQGSRTRRARWFTLGLVVGGIVAIVARGEGPATLHDLREWSARTLRSLEHRTDRRQHTDLGAQVESVASVPALMRSSRSPDAPCAVDPAPDDPCAELLAPFMKASTTPDVPTVAFESLPRVKPPVVVARRHHSSHAAPAAVASADANADDDTTAKLEELVARAPVPIIAPEQTAENDVR